MANIKFTTVTDEVRAAGTPANGEYVWASDTKNFYRGDGSTLGGILIGPGTVTAAAKTVLDDATVADMVNTLGGATSTGSGGLVRTTSPTLVTPALGTPASGTLTNCTGLPVAGITASTETALGVGSIQLGHATDTTIARSSAGVVTIEAQTVATDTNTLTLTNKTLGATTLNGTLNGGGQEVGRTLKRVVADVSGALTVAAHSGCVLVTADDITIPTTAGFNATIIAGGAHAVSFNSTVSADMAAGDIMQVVVESATVIHATLTAAASKVAFT